MTGVAHTTSASAEGPDVGVWVPAAALHAVFLAVAAGLVLLVLESPLWRAAGVLLAVAGTVLATVVPAWWTPLLLGVSQLGREPLATDASYYVLLAGVHLLYVIASLTRLVPWSARIQVAALARPLRRYVMIQVVVQPGAVGALTTLGGNPGTVPWLSVLSAVILGLVVVVLARAVYAARALG